LMMDKQFFPSGIVGNRGFGYHFAQASTEPMRLKLDAPSKMHISMSPCSAYANGNIALLSHPSSEKTARFLFGVTENTMVSQDSCKMFRGDLTKAHVDIYADMEQRIDRHQAMGIGLNEGDVRLCFLRFSNRLDVQELITEYLGKNIYGTKGFQPLPEGKVEALVACFREAGCLQYACPRDLVIWESGVIHLEMHILLDNNAVLKNNPNTTTERYVIGTHNPVGFTTGELVQIAYAADHGFIFEPYNNANKGTPAGDNSVHRKSTMYKINRVRSNDEIARFEKVQQEINNKNGELDAWLKNTPRAKLVCYGLEKPFPFEH